MQKKRAYTVPLSRMMTDMKKMRTGFLVIIAASWSFALSSCGSASKVSGDRSIENRSQLDFRKTPTDQHQSEIVPLMSGAEALAARLKLASLAKKTLDLQYYIWRNDKTGKWLANEVVKTADRGVKTRVLLDDMGTSADDQTLLTLDHHPNIEVRLFNPIGLRKWRGLGTLVEFGRVNRRMHNKSFTVDGKLAIVGGRNIADEYFDASEKMNFADFDVLAKGSVVNGVKNAFELYWNCEASVPITEVSRPQDSSRDLKTERRNLADHGKKMEDTLYGRRLQATQAARLTLASIPFVKSHAILVSDEPDKVSTRPNDASTHLAPKLRNVVGSTHNELTLVSPYFIPEKKGVAWMSDLEQRGVQVQVITNSLASTDVAAVHAGYARYRKQLLESGVEIREMKARTATEGLSKTDPSNSGLHAKTFVFDRRWVFVGSMNLDPRSLRLNTEMGLLIDSPQLAAQLLERVGERISERSYRVELDRGQLCWITHENGREVRSSREPKAGMKKWITKSIASWLPVEGQL